MLPQVRQTVKRHIQLTGIARWSRAFAALVVLASLFVPSLNWISNIQAYAAIPGADKVLDPVNTNLSAKFSFDSTNNQWQFNQGGAAVLADTIAKQQGNDDSQGLAGALSQLAAKQIGGSGSKDTSLYSANLPVKADEGITYFDNVTKLSFQMVPTFAARDGKLIDGRIVYPAFGKGQVIYTAKSNGLKEDIVLSKYIGDTLTYGYKLELPDTLEARVLEDGSVGIYSANPALFGNISFSNDEDEARVMEARKTGNKDNLVFGIPAPFIKDQNGRAGSTRYELHGKELTVIASGLKDLQYPLSVDPSVTITSSTDFESGDNEGMIDFGTAGQITRGDVTGGSLNAGWTNATGVLPSAMTSWRATAVLNGKAYALNDGDRKLYYATITGGTLSNWTAATATTLISPYGSGGFELVAYNGYLYEFGGVSSSGSNRSVAQAEYYAQPTVSGDVTAWTSLQASSPWGPRGEVAATAYDGYMYLYGGCTVYGGGFSNGNCNATANDTWMAPINATGTLGTWVQQTSATPSAAMTTLRFEDSIVGYNGYLYLAGGCTITNNSFKNCDTYTGDVSYAKIGANGTVGPWQSTSSMITGRGGIKLVAYNDYLYIAGGCKGQNCSYSAGVPPEYAPINANGSVGSWTATSTTSSGGSADRSGQIAFGYKGYIFQAGGCTGAGAPCSSARAESISARIDPAGVTKSYSTEANYEPTSGRLSFATTTYNNYLYVIGGTTGNTGAGGSMLNTARYAPINSDGSVGGWSTSTTGFANTNSGAGGQTCSPSCAGRVNLAAGAYNGYLYIAGGISNGGTTDHWSDVQSAVICTGVNAPVAGCAQAGDLRNWTTIFTDYLTNSTTTYTEANGRSKVAMQIYNGKMYLIGGQNTNSNFYSHIYTSTLTSSGGAGNFSLSGVTLPSGVGRSGVSTFVNGGKLYIVGGGTSGTPWAYNSVDQADVQFVTIDPSTGNLTGGWTDANASINGGSGSSFAAANGKNAYGVAVSNGVLYITGGYVGGALPGLNSVSMATINANGSLSSWTTTTSFTTGRVGLGTVAVRGSLYIIGGCSQLNIIPGNYCNGAPQILTTYQNAQINNGGTGQTGSWTASPSGSGGALGGYASYNGYVYSVRGCNGAIGSGDLACDNAGISTQISVYAAVNQDGSFGSWQTLNTSGSAPSARYGTSAVAYNGYLYVLGGCTAYASSACSAYSKQVYYAPITSTGNVGTWATTTDFDASTGRYGTSAVAYNGYLYVLGGCTANSSTACTAYENTVRVAQINSDGTVGAWSSAGSNFTTARFYQSAVINSGRLYVIGGCSAMVTDGCTGLLNDVQVVSLSTSNGTFSGSWQTSRSFVTPRAAFGATVYDGYLYVTGGCGQFNVTGGNCANYLSDVQYAPITSSGHIGSWNKTVTSLTNGVMGQGLEVSNGNLVVLFGIKATHTYESVARSSVLQVQPRVGNYSKLVQVSSAVEIANVYYNASVGPNMSVTYKVAPLSGVFASNGTALPGSGSEPTPKCGAGAFYYVRVSVTIDDTKNASFGESSQGNVTDITIYYRQNATPPPNLRLNGGKWFYAETQQALDTCKS